ncbi:MAG: alpha/beta fold hydrolase [Candidatus Micrarchaeota archaeon]
MSLGEEKREQILSGKNLSESHRKLALGWNVLSAIAVILFLSAIGIWYFFFSAKPLDWSVSEEGLLSYSPRGGIIYSEALVSSEGDTLLKIEFESRGTTVHGLLRIPKIAGEAGTGTNETGGDASIGASSGVPGIVLLPGAGVTKEGEQKVASELARMGYASLTIDQRGIGESKEKVGDLNSNYEIFLRGKEPPVYEMIHDALRAYDLLRERHEIDSGRIFFMGESMGGRTAIIAAALEPRARGAVGISTGGYGLGGAVVKNNLTLFQKSIDPDAYIGMIAPGKVLMIHSKRDDVVGIENARRTYVGASEPKRFVEVDCNTHGYCVEMKEELGDGLAWIVSGS